MIQKILNYLIRWVPALFSLIVAFVSLFPASLDRLEEDIALQAKRISELEQAYESESISPVDENSIYDGDLDAVLKSGVKFNEMSFIATHNSYQTTAIDEAKNIYRSLSDLTFGIYKAKKIGFESETLTDQLECGLRSFELDIETFDRDGDVSFTCMHSPYFEMSTSCYDFSLALKEISMWSDNNPDHLPITIIIEPKRVFIPLENMEYFNLEYALALDEVLKEGLGEKLFTPADMLRDYESFGEMRAADDWCKVRDMLGKVVVLLHDCGVTEDYIDIDESVKTQAMFPMLRERDIDRDCTSFIICNNPGKLLEIKGEVIDEKKIMVRTRADEFGKINKKNLEDAFASGANIISTDYPVRTDNKADDYIVDFGNRTTVSK
ncbi:MAG: hypothetical protein IKW12_00765 [Clostridia bacterium]|nr:hypothetical protein [Clostridia bacterium]